MGSLCRTKCPYKQKVDTGDIVIIRVSTKSCVECQYFAYDNRDEQYVKCKYEDHLISVDY